MKLEGKTVELHIQCNDLGLCKYLVEIEELSNKRGHLVGKYQSIHKDGSTYGWMPLGAFEWKEIVYFEVL